MKEKNGPGFQGNPKITKPSYSNTLKSQRQIILDHFKKCPQLSTIQARDEYGILHPSGRVMELRKNGYCIDTYRITESDANGAPHCVGLYVYQGKHKGIS